MPGLIGPALTFAFPSIFVAGSTLTTVASYAIYTAGTMYALDRLQKRAMEGMGGTRANIREVDGAKAVIYGQTRVGGVVTYLESTDNQSNLHSIICLAGHPVEEISDIFIDDHRIDASYVGQGDYSGGLVVISPTDPYKEKVSVYNGDGTVFNSVPISVLGIYSEVIDEDDFVGNGVSFLYTRLKYNSEVFTNGVPTFNALVKGRKIYDPRKDSTSDAYDATLGVDTHRKTTESTWEYSDNPALCILDYITQEHGLNADFDEIDDQEWADEADICDEQVALDGGGTQTRYQMNGLFTRDRTPSEVLPTMLSSCGGSLFYAQGKWVLRVGKWRTPLSDTFNEDDLRGPLSIDTKASRRDIFNAVTGQIATPEEDWIPTDYPMITSSTFETEDGGQRNVLDLPLPFTSNMIMAQRLAKQTLYRAREQIVVTGRFGLKAFQCRVGDNIKLTNERLGWTNKTFEVIGWKFSYGSGEEIQVDLTLKEISEAVFDWNAEEASFSTNNTSLPKFNYAPQPAFGGTPTTEVIIQEDGTAIASADVSWSVTEENYVNDYVLEWKRETETNYQSIVTTNLYYRVPSVEIGEIYDFRIRSRNRLGISSETSEVSFRIIGDITPPALPTLVSVTGGYQQIIIDWDNPDDADFDKVEVYSNTINSLTGVTKIGETYGSFFTDSSVGDDETRYYFLKSVDYTGNDSGFTGTSGNSATTRAAIGDGASVVPVYADDASGTNKSYTAGSRTHVLYYEYTDTKPPIGDVTGTFSKFVGEDGPEGPTGPEGPQGDTGATGDTGGRYVTVRYYAESASTPNTTGLPSGVSYTWATATATASYGVWSTTTPTVDAAGSNDYWYIDITFVDSTGEASFSYGSTKTSPVALFNFNGLVTFTNTSGTTDLNNALADSSTIIDGGRITTGVIDADLITAGTIQADRLNVDNVTMSSSGGSLIIKNGGVDTNQLNTSAVVTSTIADRAATDATVVGSSPLTLSNTGSTSLGSFSTTEASQFIIVQAHANAYGSGTGTSYSLALTIDGTTVSIFVNSSNDDYATYDDLRFPVSVLDRLVVSSSGSHSLGLSYVIQSGSTLEINNLDVVITLLKR